MLKLRRFIKPHWKGSVIAALLKLLEAYLELLLPFFMAQIVDFGLKKGDMSFVYRTAIKMLVIAVIGLIAVLICQYSASIISCRIGADIRSEMMRKISGMSFSNLDKFGTHTMVTRMTTDVNNVIMGISMLIRLATRAPFLCIGAVFMSIKVDFKLSLVFFFLIPIFGAFLYGIITKTVPYLKAIQKQLDKTSLVLRENLSGVRVIRALARQRTETKRVGEAVSELSRVNIIAVNIANLVNPVTILLMNAGIFLVLYFGGIRVDAGSLTQGEIIAMINYMTQVFSALLIISNLINIFTKSSTSASRIIEVLDNESELEYKTDLKVVSNDKNTNSAAVEFDNVSFAYVSDHPALSDISFTIPKNTSFGIIGTTGSGKTTIANLMSRFYDVTDGSIMIDGQNVKDYSKGSIIEKFGIAPQRAVLFTGTIAENIRFAKQDATDEEIEDALKTAQSYDFVKSLKRGINSKVKQGGQNFSGGQRQRLCIARALVKKPDILILDDSLSALDYHTDLMLRKALKTDLSQTTLVIISQRVSSVSSCDKIMVLDEGRVDGIGTHDELLEISSIYRDIHTTQTMLNGGAAI